MIDLAEHCGGECRTLPMWKGFHDMANKYFDSITLEDLIKGNLNISQ